jgi:hypothetical protein
MLSSHRNMKQIAARSSLSTETPYILFQRSLHRNTRGLLKKRSASRNVLTKFVLLSEVTSRCWAGGGPYSKKMDEVNYPETSVHFYQRGRCVPTACWCVSPPQLALCTNLITHSVQLTCLGASCSNQYQNHSSPACSVYHG